MVKCLDYGQKESLTRRKSHSELSCSKDRVESATLIKNIRLERAGSSFMFSLFYVCYPRTIGLIYATTKELSKFT